MLMYEGHDIWMMLLTLTVLWLDSRSTERMAVAGVNLICHILCMFDLHWQLPHNGINPPKYITVLPRFISFSRVRL